MASLRSRETSLPPLLRSQMLAATPAYQTLLALEPLPNVAGLGNSQIGVNRHAALFTNNEISTTERMDYHLSFQ